MSTTGQAEVRLVADQTTNADTATVAAMFAVSLMLLSWR